VQGDQSVDHTCYTHGVTICTFQQFPPVIDYKEYRFLKHLYQITYQSNYCSETFNPKPVIHCTTIFHDNSWMHCYNRGISNAVGYSLLWTHDISQSEVSGRAGLRAPAGAQLSSSPQRQGQLLSGGYQVSFAKNKALGAKGIPPLPHAPLHVAQLIHMHIYLDTHRAMFMESCPTLFQLWGLVHW